MKEYPDEPFEPHKGAGLACYPAHFSEIAIPPYEVETKV